MNFNETPHELSFPSSFVLSNIAAIQLYITQLPDSEFYNPVPQGCHKWPSKVIDIYTQFTQTHKIVCVGRNINRCFQFSGDSVHFMHDKTSNRKLSSQCQVVPLPTNIVAYHICYINSFMRCDPMVTFSLTKNSNRQWTTI